VRRGSKSERADLLLTRAVEGVGVALEVDTELGDGGEKRAVGMRKGKER
jgi:hypothetical protein